MGTYLNVTASDIVLERIADVPAGTCDQLRPLIISYYEHLADSNERQDDSTTVNEIVEHIAAIHPNATRLWTLLDGEAFGKFQGLELAVRTGLDLGCGHTENIVLITEMLRTQRRTWGRRCVYFLGSRGEKRDCIVRQRQLCWNAIEAAQRGEIDSVYWA